VVVSGYRYPSDYCSEPTHAALAVQTPATLDALLIHEAPLLRDAYLAYAMARVQGEVSAILFGAVDDETFDRVQGAFGLETDREFNIRQAGMGGVDFT
jgi:hypothetical protein